MLHNQLQLLVIVCLTDGKAVPVDWVLPSLKAAEDMRGNIEEESSPGPTLPKPVRISINLVTIPNAMHTVIMWSPRLGDFIP